MFIVHYPHAVSCTSYILLYGTNQITVKGWVVADYIYSQLVKLLVVNGHLSCERQFQGDEILSNGSTSSTFLYLLTRSIYFIAIYAEDRCERYNYWKSLNLLVSCNSFQLKERFQMIVPYTKMIKMISFFYKSSFVYSSIPCCWRGFHSTCANICLYLIFHKQRNNHQILLTQFQQRDNNRFWLLYGF